LIKALQADNSPFIIGLTGHLDLKPAQVPQLVAAVASFLREIKRHLSDTDVRVMLDARHDLGLEIARAGLALDVAVDALIAATAPVGAGASSPGNLCFDPRVHGIEAPEAEFADILIRRSSLLLALWDGRPSGAPDDTADQVFRFLGVRGEHSAALDRIELSTLAHDPDLMQRPVYWVPARRSGDDDVDSAAQPCYLVSAGDSVLDVAQSMPSSLKRRLADLNEYNLEFEQLTANERLARSDSLMPDHSAMPAANDAAILENIDRQFVKADALAGYMQRRSDRLFNAFGIAAFTMGLAYLVYDKITESKLLLMFYIFILCVSLVVYYFFQTKRWFGKHLSYRALAETLRVRFYLAMAGVDRQMQPRALIELTGIYRFAGFGWISCVLDSIEPTTPAGRPSNEIYEARARLVDRAWIEDQHRYFVRKVASMERHRFWIGRLRSGVFVAALLVLSAMFMLGAAAHNIDARTGLPLQNVLTFCSGTLAVVLAVWELRQNKMAMQELLWQYRNQLSQFQRARIQLSRIASRARRDALLKELGENSLMEVYLWAIHRYHREHAPPAAP
jgi:hypothetical protein